jgi:serine/threonine-protein kinase SRPK3
MQEMASDDLPKRWQNIWDTMDKGEDVTAGSSEPNLQEWLEEVYFDGRRTPDLTRRI